MSILNLLNNIINYFHLGKIKKIIIFIYTLYITNFEIMEDYMLI